MTYLEPLTEDQWFIDSPELKQFVAIVRAISDRTTHNRAETLSAIEPYFTQLLKTQGWLSDRFTKPNPDSSMGGGIGQWLLYRSQDRATVFSLVIPPNSTTPIHDH